MVNLKTLPITFTGDLHQVKLISFSVATDEVLPNLPSEIKPIIEDDRVQFSLVSVELQNMKSNVFPLSFGYHHVALRLRIKDAGFNKSGKDQGIYFYKSFSNNPMMVAGGKVFTNYNLQKAQFDYSNTEMEVLSDDGYIKFALDLRSRAETSTRLYQDIERLDRAYFVAENQLYRTVITRKEWPIQWAECFAFETNLFNTAKLEGAFFIDHPIHYKWNKPELVTPVLLPESATCQRLKSA